MRTRIRLINQVRAQLRQQGLRVGSGDAETFAQQVATRSLPSRPQQQVEVLLTTSRLPVIHHGETGTGKEVFAQLIRE